MISLNKYVLTQLTKLFVFIYVKTLSVQYPTQLKK